ncbi:MAG TPA: histidine kinase, partial [Cytophagales bacterium]|nr:histidine kinase [Cytophagales bacterium]
MIFAKADTLTFTSSYQRVDKVLFIKDTTGYKIEQVKDLFLKNLFQPGVDYQVANNEGSSIYWISFILKNITDFDQEFLLNFDKWSYVDFYFKSGKNYKLKKAGLISSLYITIHNSGYSVELMKLLETYSFWYNKMDIMISSFSSICFLLLTRSFLKTKINLPFWDKVLTASVLTLLLIPLVISFISNNLAFTIQGATILAIAFLFLFVSGLGYYRKIPSSGYFFFANLFMLIGVIPLMLKELQVLPENLFTINSFNIGSCIQATLFSLAFANRINTLKEENEAKQSEIISQLKENEKVLIAWKEALINTEKLQKESLAFQYESLKNQVNPHFLFNSLNVLIGLLYKSPEEASKFVRELAQVYRYVLQNKNKEIVELSDELEFVNAFIHLLKIRFGDSLIINNRINRISGISIPPLTLQMLIENAIKHNTFSSDKPLVIDLSSEGNYLVVSNNIQLKKIPEEPSGIGLNNLRNRYKYLTNCEIIVLNNG